MKKSLLKMALKIARRTLEGHPQKRHFLHWSFVVQGNQIMEWRTNQASEPPRHYGYHSRLRKGERGPGIPKTHSEMNAYRKTRGVMSSRGGFEIINVRLSRKGEMRLNKPCPCCVELMWALGCKRFWFSWEGGFLKSGAV